LSVSDGQGQLLRLAETLERVARQLRQLANDSRGPNKRNRSILPGDFVDKLRSSDRNIAIQELSVLSQAQLGEVFAQLGGSSRDRKRAKEWLIERIIWRLFDFQAGHEIIRGSP
jgi:hypothetical protein